MNRTTKFLTSSVGRKLVMSLSGLFLCSFLVVHVYVNLFLFKADNGGTYDAYSEFLATYPLIRPLEIILFLGFLLHAIFGVWLWYLNRRVRPEQYAVRRPLETSSFSSRLTFWTGLVVFIFLVVHIDSFFIPSRFGSSHTTMFEIVADAFRSPLYDAFYVIAIIFLAFHLKHGFESAFQTLGIRHHGRYQLLIDIIAAIFWLLIPLGFAAMPLYFLWAH